MRRLSLSGLAGAAALALLTGCTQAEQDEAAPAETAAPTAAILVPVPFRLRRGAGLRAGALGGGCSGAPLGLGGGSVRPG